MTESDRSMNAGSSGRPLLSDLVAAPPEPAATQPLSSQTWLKIAILGLLMVAVSYWQLPLLAGKWWHDPNWSHGALIPLFSLYLLYARRRELLAAPRRVCLWGLPLLILSLIAQVLAYWPVSNDWLLQLCIPVILFGLVLYLAGPQVAKLTWLPIFFLAFALPMPNRLYGAMALPLQELAAFCSALILRIGGVQIDVTASHLTVISHSGVSRELTVAEACSGMRSLMAFVAIGVAIAYLDERPNWQRVVLVALAVPIAIFCNVIRVSVTGVMFVIDRPELGQDFMHEFMGLVILIPAFLMLWGVGWLLQRLMVEEEDPPAVEGSSGEGGRG